MSNLVENAMKFTEEGVIEFGYELNDDKLKFFVKDSGPGIEEKDREFIFGRFNQGKKHDTHNRGSGLGLSIVKGLIELLEGEVWVESTVGVGSTFFVTLPNTNKHCLLSNRRSRRRSWQTPCRPASSLKSTALQSTSPALAGCSSLRWASSCVPWPSPPPYSTGSWACGSVPARPAAFKPKTKNRI